MPDGTLDQPLRLIEASTDFYWLARVNGGSATAEANFFKTTPTR